MAYYFETFFCEQLKNAHYQEDQITNDYEISVSLMSVMVLKKPKNVKPVEVLVKQNLMVIMLKVLLQLSLGCYGLPYGAGKSFKNYKMPIKKIGGLCKAPIKHANLFYLFYIWF